MEKVAETAKYCGKGEMAKTLQAYSGGALTNSVSEDGWREGFPEEVKSS